MDGTNERRVNWAAFGDFDSAVLSPRGDLAALIDSDGTKALLLEPGGRVVRELSRSGYHANAYRYPLALFILPDGRTGLVHCPDHYNQLEIEVAATGERLTGHPARAPIDLFHSRLQVSPSGTTLLSAGWYWHPFGTVALFDIATALQDPWTLDRDALGPHGALQRAIDAEVAGACWLGEDVIVTTSEEDMVEGDGLPALTMARWSLPDERFLWRRPAPANLGDIVSFGDGYLALNGHPRLFDGTNGDLIMEWPDLTIAPTEGSIFLRRASHGGSSAVAVDQDRRRFAVAQTDRVVVVDQIPEGRA